MQIRIAQGTTFVTKDGKSYFSGDTVEVDAETAESMIRTGSALPVEAQKEYEHGGN